MRSSDWDGVIAAATPAVRDWLHALGSVRVGHAVAPDDVRAAIDGRLDDEGVPPAEVVRDLVTQVTPYVTAHASGRFFGYVIGGLHPAALGAEMLVAAWDQNAGLYEPTPGVTVVEEHAARWLVDLLGLPGHTSVAFVTGGQMANWTCLAAARGHVLDAVGWDVTADGLVGAPEVTVVVKETVHSTVPRALRFLGLGERTAVRVATDGADRIDVTALERALATCSGPTIVCLEAGNVNTGSFDPFDAVVDLVDEHRDRGNPSWVHVDGAVGLLAAAAPSCASLTAGLARADSWSTDAHKLLNAAYDCGIAMTAHPGDHHTATSVRASYLRQEDGGVREPMDWNPEFSRRARGVGVYATLRSLGRDGLVELVDRVRGLAHRFADGLAASGAAEVVTDVELNQVLVRWLPPDGVDPDTFNDAVTDATARDGRTYFSGTTRAGERLMRISVSDWATDEADVDLALEVLLELAETEAARLAGAVG